MKQQLAELFNIAIEQLKHAEILPQDHDVALMFERTRQKEHGDFATNVAMTLAKVAKSNPRQLAEKIVAALPQSELIEKLDIAGPGFINIFIKPSQLSVVVNDVLAQAEQYGLAAPGSGQRILIEYVSANPTGPLHVGHGRGAAYGDALARLLTAAGHKVHREYYVNDAGRQMDILATSVWLRFCQLNGADIAFPKNGYQGDYIMALAKQIDDATYVINQQKVVDATQDLEDEDALDALIALAKAHLGADGYRVFFDLALNSILADIRTDLSEFGVDYDSWYSERSLFDSAKIDAAIEALKNTEFLYEQQGALWFKSSALGDEKDRVVVRDNGQPTYFASDIAYHLDKYQRGFDQCINIWGADHHGYVPRVKAAIQALGLNPELLTVLLVQFAVLYRGGEKISMSTRAGDFVELKQLRDEVGNDACRFFYVQRKSEQHMDFDLDLAKSQSNDNPVYYVQYAHARIASIFAQVEERELNISVLESADVSLLDSDHELALLTLLQKFPEVVSNAAAQFEPHQITYYLRDLANAYHSYYNAVKFLDADVGQRDAMLALNKAVKQVLKNGLTMVGVSAPEKM